MLIDTQVFLWASIEPHRLSPTASRVLSDSGCRRWVSTVSGFEIATKVAIGKVRLDLAVPTFMSRGVQALAATTLPMSMEHATGVVDLPLHHRDPFDRLLVTQARMEGLSMLSADGALAAYEVAILW